MSNLSQKDYYGIAQAERRSRIFEENAKTYKKLLWFEIIFMTLIGGGLLSFNTDISVVKSLMISGFITMFIFIHEVLQIIIWSIFSVVWGILTAMLLNMMLDEPSVAVVIGVMVFVASFTAHYAGWKYIMDEASGVTGFLFD